MLRQYSISFALLFLFSISACTFQNHNPGENEADVLWQQEDYSKALEIIEPAAEQGLPWAQLRLGIAYEYGQGKSQSYGEALGWYRKASTQSQDNGWSDGILIGLGGERGYFNQNNDARMAQYLIARILFNGGYGVEKDLPQAWLWANYVTQSSGGNDLIYCCEESRRTKQIVESFRVSELFASIEAGLNPSQITQLEQIANNWTPR